MEYTEPIGTDTCIVKSLWHTHARLCPYKSILHIQMLVLFGVFFSPNYPLAHEVYFLNYHWTKKNRGMMV